MDLGNVINHMLSEPRRHRLAILSRTATAADLPELGLGFCLSLLRHGPLDISSTNSVCLALRCSLAVKARYLEPFAHLSTRKVVQFIAL